MKKFFAFLLSAAMVSATFTTFAADETIYTFSGVNAVTDGSTNEVIGAQLTDKITVTTSGAMNRKYAAVTDLEHNKEVGTFPISENFKADGSYIYLATASSNDNTIITLNMPKIDKGSKVTLTFAKPTVTNNGSTLRNTNDPYAYLKIADRYISINGDNFDQWRTESIVTGEDTSAIEFHCDKWGAVAISKIEISDGDGKPLHSLDISSTQYANLKVNGIKFYADENGKLTVPSLPEGEEVTILAEKDGYKPAEKEIKIAQDSEAVEIPLECEINAAYYESDFGNTAGTLALDGEFGIGVEAKDVTKIISNVTFGEKGVLVLTDNLTLSYKEDGIYANDTFVTSKDNMEFEAVLDKENDEYVIIQNKEKTTVTGAANVLSIDKISGSNATLEYIGVTYPDPSKITIEGPDKYYCISNEPIYIGVGAEAIENEDILVTVSGEYIWDLDNVEITVTGDAEYENESIKIPAGTTGKINVHAEYALGSSDKEIEIYGYPTLDKIEHTGKTLNLGETSSFSVEKAEDLYGNTVSDFEIRNCSSSDESVIKITPDGIMKAVGKGKATITANVFTGQDNYISVDYCVDKYYESGVADGDITYIPSEFSDEHIIAYKANLIKEDSIDPYVRSQETIKIEKTQIPASTIKKDGTVIISEYLDGQLVKVKKTDVKQGDRTIVSNGTKKVMFYSDNEFTEITDADTTMEGFALETKDFYAYMITPVYRFDNIGDVKEEGKTLDATFASNCRCNITFKKAETGRGDIYVNGFMVGNNVDQADADRKVEDGALYTAEDILIKDGTINVSMCDGSTMLDYVEVECELIEDLTYQPRTSRIYVIGDSLACNYYGAFENEVGGGRSGWGQQLHDFVNCPVTNLANSGQFAAGLYKTAFPSVIENGQFGDILLIECGYNDRNYSTREEMTYCVKDMIKQCRKKGIVPIIVTPNASQHDYKPSVVWSSYLRDIAVDTGCGIIDLSKESYDFLYSLYGDNADGEVTKNFNLTEVGGDTLHSSYAGAYKWASIVAKGIKDILKEDILYNNIVNTDFSYTFTDTLGNEIVAKAE